MAFARRLVAMVSDLILAPPLWIFVLMAAAVAIHRRRHRPAMYQALCICACLCLMAVPHADLWEFGVWVFVAYLVDLVGDDAAPGTLLIVSALFYPLTALGFNSWWCQFGANLFGVLALGVVGGMGSGIWASVRHSRRSGIDVMGRVWSRSAS